MTYFTFCVLPVAPLALMLGYGIIHDLIMIALDWRDAQRGN